jgi:hypothetical protein
MMDKAIVLIVHLILQIAFNAQILPGAIPADMATTNPMGLAMIALI